MFRESINLTEARQYLPKAERYGIDERTPALLDEAGFLLQHVANLETKEQIVARNLGKTYGKRFRALVQNRLSRGKLDESELSLIREILDVLRSSPMYVCPGLKDTQTLAMRMYWEKITVGIPEDVIQECIASEQKKRAAAQKATKLILEGIFKKPRDSKDDD